MVQTQGFLDDSTTVNVFNHLAFSQLATHFGTANYLIWDENRTPVWIDLVRPKSQNRRFYIFLDHDAIVCLKDWLAVRKNLTDVEIKIHENTSR